MFPVLLEIGPLVIKTMNVFLVLALLTGLFIFWRKGKEEHYDEVELFDGLFLGQLLGIVVARAVYIITNFSNFGFDPIAWVDIFGNPGFALIAFFIVSGYYLFRYSLKKKWDAYEILDFWVLAVSFSSIWVWLGYFTEGIFFGTQTQLPIGIVFPGVFDAHHPLQLYLAIFYMGLAWYLGWVEYRYRTFEWYRKGKNTAQTGFLFALFLICNGIAYSLLSFISIPSMVVYGLRIDTAVAIIVMLLGFLLLYSRSGRYVFSPKSKVRAKKLEKFPA
jgi:prolipoprotein diacylglyceryltransferase